MKQKLEKTQVGDIPAAMRKWESIVSQGPELMRHPELKKYGGTVFAYSHMIKTRHTIAMKFYDEKNTRDLENEELASRLSMRHACIFYITSANESSVAVQIIFGFNEQQTEIENIICIDHATGMVYVLPDGKMLNSVLKKIMLINDNQLKISYEFSAN